jgi:hypothetical protein
MVICPQKGKVAFLIKDKPTKKIVSSLNLEHKKSCLLDLYMHYFKNICAYTTETSYHLFMLHMYIHVSTVIVYTLFKI